MDLFLRKNQLTFSSKLDWSSCIISTAKTASKKFGVLICSMKFLSPKVPLYPGPILESKGMHAIFQKKDKKMFKKDKIFENLGKNAKFENIFKKGRSLCAIIACNKLLEKALVSL